MSHVITCPSGLTGRIRGMKVREERVLADRKLAKSGGQVDALLGACWEETLEPGPYDFGDTTAFDRREKTGRERSESEGRHSEGGRKDIDWGAVLQGDRFFALLQVRALTYGPTYAFALGCQNEGCRARFEWELDLTELPVRPLTDESRAAFTDGNRFETTLPDEGVRVWFRLFTGVDERKLPQIRRNAGERILSAMLGWRVVEVEGVSPRDNRESAAAASTNALTDPAYRRAVRLFLVDLSMRDADFLVDEFDRVDCGVDTAIEVECPECFTLQEVELPFDRGFFLPGKARTARRLSHSHRANHWLSGVNRLFGVWRRL